MIDEPSAFAFIDKLPLPMIKENEMKRFYSIRVVKLGKMSIQIVKAESEADAREMVSGGVEILDVQEKGLV